ncbi:E3 ubiquitin-protein ligase RAD18 [Apiospora marii]|uniref:Postreplication repair E3 ubiquitin-protein ligase RAD18 n=1 Tax=Apiospora marii TaxID=335849 RepID=A0ABR1SI34_9PEZI
MAADKAFDDIADSTDWLTTPLPGLAAVEAALRCQICKDFYNTPMLTSCNHTFCSMCIRRALAADAKCSLCRSVQEVSKLRSNWAMEEAVLAFVKTRADLLDLARKPPTVLTVEVPVAATSSSPAKRLRSSARKSKTRGAELTSEMARQEASFPVPSHHSVPAPDQTYNDGLVACPICLERMKEVQVDRHIDSSCPGAPRELPTQPPKQKFTSNTSNQRNGFQVLSTSAPAPPKPERLPTLSYSMLKDAALRKKLADLGIPANGTRQILEKRHQEWITIWNANCDSLHPKRKSELLQELEVWEKTLGARAPTSSRSIHLGEQIKDKGFDHAAWSAKHDSSFQDLVASARKTRAQALQKANQNQPTTETPSPPHSTGASTTTPAAAAPSSASPSRMDVDQQAPLSMVQPPTNPGSAAAPSYEYTTPCMPDRSYAMSELPHPPPLEAAAALDRSRNGASEPS